MTFAHGTPSQSIPSSHRGHWLLPFLEPHRSLISTIALLHFIVITVNICLDPRFFSWKTFWGLGPFLFLVSQCLVECLRRWSTNIS